METKDIQPNVQILSQRPKTELLQLLKDQFKITKGVSRKTKLQLAQLYVDEFGKQIKTDNQSKKKVKKTAKKSDKQKVKKEVSKSELVRRIVRNLENSHKAYTSRTVMELLKKKHGLDIHRSFCCTIIKECRE